MSRWLAGPALLAGLVVVAGAAGVRVNLTASMPPGLYRTVGGAVPARGAVVVTCLPPAVGAFALARHYLPRGDCPGGVWPVGKPVAAVAGDTVEVRAAGILVNGHAIANSRVLPVDAAGRATPAVPSGRYLVAPGALWLVSSYSTRSFDSRYYGPVAIAQVRTVVRPLWTVGARPAPRPAPVASPDAHE